MAFLSFILTFLTFLIGVWLYFLPVRIARVRDIPSKQRIWVFWLTVFGFLGITWLLAFIMACSPYPAKKDENGNTLEVTVKQSRADQLVKLSELRKDGFLTEEEFEKEKALLM